MSIVYLNGQFIPKEDAKISVFDRGFLFSDGVYEVIPAYQGKLLGMNEHLERLEQSLNYIKMDSPLSMTEWKLVLEKLLTKNNGHDTDQAIYLQVTRGAQADRHHSIPSAPTPTVFAFTTPHDFPKFETVSQGLSAITLEDRRRLDCCIKGTGLLPNVLAYQQALDVGAIEAILIRDGQAMEASSSNVFIVQNNTLITPPLSSKILGGVTREIVLNLLAQNNIPHREANITEDELYQADEVWLTSSVKEIYPIIKLNDKPVGDGKVGPLWKAVIQLYYAKKEKTSHLRGI